MNKDSQIIKSGRLIPQTTNHGNLAPVDFHQTGNNNTQIGYVQNCDVNQTIVLLSGAAPAGVPTAGQNAVFNYDCFNFFVIGAEQYDESSFIVPKDRALTESTSKEMMDLCASLSPEAIAAIKTFPAIFCSENHHFTTTDSDHIAYYGYVTDIKVQDNGIKVYFVKLNQIPQQVLIELSEELCIGRAKSFTELCRTHWAIKRINAVEVLERAGWSVFKL